MQAERRYLGCPGGMESLIQQNDSLNARVLEQVNDSQELLMLSNFTFESDEYCLRKSLQERIAEITSWHWVLSDLARRLGEAAETLRHEHKALRVVVERLRAELGEVCVEGGRPGALCPGVDCVENAIQQEIDFLKDQKKMFEFMIPALEENIKKIEKTKNRIERDIQIKQEAISVDENITKLDPQTAVPNRGKKKKKKYTTIARWESRCASLKNEGLQALTSAIITRQQARGTRAQLSVAAQAYASRVDAGLRRRLHSNRTTAQELAWQKAEATRDYRALEEELRAADKKLIENMEKERLVEVRIEDRRKRPPGELTKDTVDRQLKEELGRLKRYTKELRSNVERIMSLQQKLSNSIARIDNCLEDLFQVIQLDEERIRSRTGNDESTATDGSPTTVEYSSISTEPRRSTISAGTILISHGRSNTPLETIQEDDEEGYDNQDDGYNNQHDGYTTHEDDDEEDDYPFDD